MRKYIFLLAATLVLSATIVAAKNEIPARDASQPLTISPEDLQTQVDGRSLPPTLIEEPY